MPQGNLGYAYFSVKGHDVYMNWFDCFILSFQAKGEDEFVGLWHYCSDNNKNSLMANMETQQFSESQKKHYVNYARNYLALGVMWGIFTICFAIINIVVFVQPQWIGDTEISPGIGYFGLYQFCELFQAGQELLCLGQFDDFPTIVSPPFQAATFFIGFSFLTMLICVLCLLLFAFIKPDKVFYGCGCLQMLSGKMILYFLAKIELYLLYQ